MAFEQEAMQKAVCASAVLPFSAISPKAAVKGSIPSLTTDRARVGTPQQHISSWMKSVSIVMFFLMVCSSLLYCTEKMQFPYH